MSTLRERFEAKYEPCPMTGCWLWHGWINEYGYGLFSAHGHIVTAHRFAYELYRNEIPIGMHVLHHCDVRACVSPLHLFAGTPSDNSRDMTQKMRQAWGSKNKKSHLTIKDILLIRHLSEQGASQRELARQFNISQPNIGYIVRREIWRHI